MKNQCDRQKENCWKRKNLGSTAKRRLFYCCNTILCGFKVVAYQIGIFCWEECWTLVVQHVATLCLNFSAFFFQFYYRFLPFIEREGPCRFDKKEKNNISKNGSIASNNNANGFASKFQNSYSNGAVFKSNEEFIRTKWMEFWHIFGCVINNRRGRYLLRHHLHVTLFTSLNNWICRQYIYFFYIRSSCTWIILGFLCNLLLAIFCQFFLFWFIYLVIKTWWC